MTRQSLTVAIPTYNKETVIERCIESILKNNNHIDKVILIDNCSTDKTFEIAKKYEPRVFCVRNTENLGMSGNFNRCIELCDTDWLMILHADDELLPNAIKIYRKLIEKYPKLGLIHANSYSVVEGNVNTKTLSSRNTKEFYRAGIEALSCPTGVCSAVMVKKEAYDKLGNFIVSSLSSDVEMWARVASKYDVGSINEPTVIYYNSMGSTGPQSLIKRSVWEIKADWDDLSSRITKLYPEGIAREEYIQKTRRDLPGNYFAVVKANIKDRNWSNVFAGLKLIIVDNGDFWPLINIISEIIFRRVKGLFRTN